MIADSRNRQGQGTPSVQRNPRTTRCHAARPVPWSCSSVGHQATWDGPLLRGDVGRDPLIGPGNSGGFPAVVASGVARRDTRPERCQIVGEFAPPACREAIVVMRLTDFLCSRAPFSQRAR